MALFSGDCTNAENVSQIDNQVYIKQEELQTSLLLSNEHNLDAIINNVSGAKWEVTYFGQARDINDTIYSPDTNVTSTLQKYRRIDNLIIYVQSPLPSDKVENMTGDAIVNAGFIPYKGDIILAQLLNGRDVLLTIDTVEVKHYNLHNVYSITYKFFAFVDINVNIYNDIVNKVIEYYVYDKDFIVTQSSPIVLRKHFYNKLELNEKIEKLIDYYMVTFKDNKNKLIALPTTDRNIYVDTYLQNFIIEVLSSSNRIDFLDMAIIPHTHSKIYTIWDSLLKRDLDILKIAKRNLQFVPYKQDSNIFTTMLTYLQVTHIVNHTLLPYDLTTPPLYVANELISNDIVTTPIILRDAYVFSSNFYNNQGDALGILELATFNYINKKEVNILLIDTMLKEYIYWDTYDQYYGIPILIFLIKNSVLNTFSPL